jgi:hypothetical protein
MNSDGSLYSVPTNAAATNRDNPLLLRQSCLRIGEDSIVDRCSRCGVVKEEYRYYFEIPLNVIRKELYTWQVINYLYMNY